MIAGVDGCKGGWLVALAAGWPCPAGGIPRDARGLRMEIWY